MDIGNLISQLSDRLKFLESENTKLRKQLGDHQTEGSTSQKRQVPSGLLGKGSRSRSPKP